MKAYKCDICGKLYVEYDISGGRGTCVLVQAIKFKHISGPKNARECDLCKECCRSFNDWFKSREGINECEEEE